MELHRDDEASKIGMWIFIFTEFLLFGGLFLVYSVYRYRNSEAFHLAAEELNTFLGALNTIILLISSATMAMSITAVQRKQKKLALVLMSVTMIVALTFLVNKYFEWGYKIEHGLFPGSEKLVDFGQGEVLFYGLYFFMTGLHALHIIIGGAFIAVVMIRVAKEKITHDNHVLLENAGLYWHLVDAIWIFLFPLFYLIT